MSGVQTAASDPTPGGLELPRPPGVVRRYLAERPFVVDAIVAGVCVVPAVLFGVIGMVLEPSTLLVLRIVFAVLAGAALLARRSAPVLVFAIAVAALGASVFLGRDIVFGPTLFALYALAVYRSTKSAWIGAAVSAVVTVVAVGTVSVLAHARIFTPLYAEAVPAGFAVICFCVFAVLIGNNAGNRRRYLDALIERARQLARERDAQAELAAATERSRIAREMHDIVSHSLTVMIALAEGSARVAGTAPDRSAETMQLVAETGRSALADMRRLLGVLGAEGPAPAEHQPQPGVSELGELVERFRAAGLAVRITVTGTPPADVGQQLTVFRVVQEALTNALRHASLSTVVAVTVAFGPTTITIQVDDDATVHEEAVEGSGRGLLGLRERVALYGGTLEAGPRPGGGWRLRAVFDAVPPSAPTGSTSAVRP